jgi:hypothetical protein
MNTKGPARGQIARQPSCGERRCSVPHHKECSGNRAQICSRQCNAHARRSSQRYSPAVFWQADHEPRAGPASYESAKADRGRGMRRPVSSCAKQAGVSAGQARSCSFGHACSRCCAALCDAALDVSPKLSFMTRDDADLRHAQTDSRLLLMVSRSLGYPPC